jgi:hypothetical protein
VTVNLDRVSRIEYPVSKKAMNKYVLIFFVAFGLIDFLYGLFYHDQLSIVIGPAIIAITAYIALKNKKAG